MQKIRDGGTSGVPVGFYQEQGWKLWKNQIPGGGALGQQKRGAEVKVIRESQCQPGPDCREYDAGSQHRAILKANRWAGT